MSKKSLIILLFLGGIIGSGLLISTHIKKTGVKTETREIIQMKNDRSYSGSFSGSFVLGFGKVGGSISEYAYYLMYVKNNDGTIEYMKLSAQNDNCSSCCGDQHNYKTYIHFIDSSQTPHLTCKENKYRSLIGKEYGGEIEYHIYVPEGSIKRVTDLNIE